MDSTDKARPIGQRIQSQSSTQRVELSPAALGVFLDVARLCAAIPDLDELLQEITEHIGPILKVSRCMIGLYPRNTGPYSFQYVYRAPDAPDTGALVMRGAADNPAMHLLLSGGTYRCDNIAVDPRIAAMRSFYQAHRIAATMFVGLWRGDEWLGGLGVHQCDRPRHWTEEEMLLLLYISDQVALTIDLIRIQERSRQQAELLAESAAELTRFYALQGAILSGMEEDGNIEGSLPDGITRAEIRVLMLVARGLTNAEIAGALNLSRRTVESHITSMLSKLDLRNRVELARFALGRRSAPR